MYVKYIIVFTIGFTVGGVSVNALWVSSFKSIQKKKAKEKMEHDKFLQSIGVNKPKEV